MARITSWCLIWRAVLVAWAKLSLSDALVTGESQVMGASGVGVGTPPEQCAR